MTARARAITSENEVHFFTSHALRNDAYQYWIREQSLNADVCCYRYNEGLRIDDRSELIVMYFHEAGHWECSHHYESELGRACLVHLKGSPGEWRFLPEEEFQKLQAKTLRIIEARKSQGSK